MKLTGLPIPFWTRCLCVGTERRGRVDSLWIRAARPDIFSEPNVSDASVAQPGKARSNTERQSSQNGVPLETVFAGSFVRRI